MRTSFYRHLQDLAVAFHDRWGSGQLLCRAMTDLNFMRRWMAFGAIMLVVTTLTVVIGVALMFALSWQLGLIFLARGRADQWSSDSASAPAIGRVSRKSQDQAGDLATAVEESVHGIRVLKAFGRGSRRWRTSASRPRSCGDGDREGEGARGHLAWWYAAAGAGARHLPGGRRLAAWPTGQLTVGRAGGVLRHRDRGGRPGGVDGLPAVDDADRQDRHRPAFRGDGRGQHDHRTRPTRNIWPTSAVSWSSTRCTSATRTRRPARRTCSTASTCTIGRARPWRWSG